MSDVPAILRALADLAPGDTTPDLGLFDVTDHAVAGHLTWITDAVRPATLFAIDGPDAIGISPVDPRPIDRLHASDALHREEQRLRVGWLHLCGPARIGKTVRRVCMPLLVRTVRVVVEDGLRQLVPIGDPELTLAVDDPALATPYLGEPVDVAPAAERLVAVGPDATPVAPMTAAELANDLRTHRWIDAVVAAAGLQPVTAVLPAGSGAAWEELHERHNGADLVVVGGVGMYLQSPPKSTASKAALLGWAEAAGTGRSAFAHVYGVTDPSAGAEADDAAARDLDLEPLPLTDAQRDAVRRSRTEPLVVLSGAPGNGKSHAVAAVAVDAVARGRSVLVATPTSHAADVLAELLARQPGPVPVRFGSGGSRRATIAALEVLSQQLVDDDELGRRGEDLRRRRADRTAAERIVVEALEREVRSATADGWTLRLPDLRRSVPGAFEPTADHDELRRRVAAVEERASWWRRRRLRKLTGAERSVGLDVVVDAVEAAAAVRAAIDLDAIGGTEIGAAWDLLLVAEEAERAAEGAFVDGLGRHAGRWRDEGRRAVAGLVAALPMAGARRRERLAALDAEALTTAVPLWIGTLKDVEELLPAEAGLFDLVIVDEAAQVDQFRAAGALLRADRAVVVGDPRQLRHVSFVADVDVSATLARHGVAALADRLDVRRQSLYDVAAGGAPVTFLDEHFRSVPHLIDFSARRFYDGRVKVATRNPANEAEDVIDVVPATDVAGEVGVAVDLVAAMVAAGQVGIGVITPFRAHADAIEAALLERFAPEVIEAHGLRTGTAHSAQGSERDHLVVCLGLAVDDPAARWRFAEDPNLFNVLVTRGRRRLTIVTALPEAEVPRGIVADYLRHAATPPVAPGTAAADGSWTASLAAELERNGVAVRVGYPVGRWSVDICAGVGPAAVALDCAVHPDGPEAHVARHRTLRRAGWRVVDAFASRWDGDAAAAAVELGTALR